MTFKMKKESDTFPKLLLEKYQKYGNKKVAMRHKKFGIWNKYTWTDYYENVKYLCFGLMKMGLKYNDKVSIIGDNDPRWYWTELATQAAGGIAVGIFTDCTVSEVKFYLSHSESKFVFAHDQEQVDKVLEILAGLPNIVKLIYWDIKGLWFYSEPVLANIDEVIEIGRRYEKEYPTSFEKIIENTNGEDIPFILYTSGTTGLPKGSMLSYNSYITAVNSVNKINPMDEKDNYVSFIPPAWSVEQATGFVAQLVAGTIVNFPEKPETVRKDLKEILPQIITYSPRLWEAICSEIQAKMNDVKGLKKLAHRIFLPIGRRKEQFISNKKDLPLFLKLLSYIADFLLFKGIKDEFGLSRVKLAYTGGALISPDVLKYFSTIGVNLKNVYWLSEFPFISVHRNKGEKSGTCGPPLPHWDVKIGDDGMILVKGGAFFKGYYKNPDETAKMFRDGWGITGDIGSIDEDGHLIVFGRLSDFRELKNGRTFSLDYLETRLRFSPYIRDCIAVAGRERDYVSLMVNIDYQNVGNWANKRHIGYTTFSDLSQKSQVYDLLQKEIEYLNNNLPDWLRIRKFVLLHKQLDPDEAELTRTRKLRREFLENRYADIIDAIYKDENEFMMETEIIYQDGTKGLSKTKLRIKDI